MKKTIGILALVCVFTFTNCCNEKKSEQGATTSTKTEGTCDTAKKFASTGNELKIVAIITLKENAIDELMPHYKKLIAASQAEAGCLYYDLHKDVNDTTNTKFMMVELWKDQAAIDAHNQMPHMAEFRNAAGDKVASTEVVVLKIQK